MMLLLAAFAVLTAQAQEGDPTSQMFTQKANSTDGVTSSKWKKWTWTSSKTDGKHSYSEGMAYQCLTPNPLTCETNADCGSALCVSIKTSNEAEPTKYCGCGDFERHFHITRNGATTVESVQVCSCDYADSEGTCLPIWRNTIMCKFACKNCFNCDEKEQEDCQDDKTCAWDADSSTCTNHADQICEGTEGNALPKEECKHTFCKWMDDYDGNGNGKCKSRSEVRVELATTSKDRNCPLGTKRLRDSYKGTHGSYFDTCVPQEKVINDCEFYEWDGESCSYCRDGFRKGTMSSNRGDGRLIENALCVKADSIFNDGCAVFKFAVKKGRESAQDTHHHCERCMHGFSWEQLEDGSRDEGKCVKEQISAAGIFAYVPPSVAENIESVDRTTWLLAGAGLASLLGLAKLTQTLLVKAEPECNLAESA